MGEPSERGTGLTPAKEGRKEDEVGRTADNVPVLESLIQANREPWLEQRFPTEPCIGQDRAIDWE